MDNADKAQKYAKRCFRLAAAKVAVAGGGALATEFAPFMSFLKGTTSISDIYIWVAVGEMIFGIVFIAVTYLKFYQEHLVTEKRRRVTRRLVGGAMIADSVSLMVSHTWPTHFDYLLSLASLVLAALLFLTFMHEYDDGSGPRRKRKRFKAKWPSWIKKRWSAARPIPKPTPAPKPVPGRA